MMSFFAITCNSHIGDMNTLEEHQKILSWPSNAHTVGLSTTLSVPKTYYKNIYFQNI